MRRVAVRKYHPDPYRAAAAILVVLPFDKLGDDADEHAVDAIVEDLTTELSRYAAFG